MQVDAAIAFARDRAAHSVDHAEHAAALALYFLDSCEGVVGFTGLADPDVESSFLNDRSAVSELRGWLGIGGHPCKFFDELRAQQAGIVGRSTAENLDPLDGAHFARIQV